MSNLTYIFVESSKLEPFAQNCLEIMENTEETINGIDRINNILHNYPFSAVKTSLSYIHRLFPHLGCKAPVLLFYINKVDNGVGKDKDDCNDTKSESFMELTGSPLEQSYGDDSFNISIVPVKKNWLKDEEKHLPLSRRTAAEFINVVQEEIRSDENWTLPIFALCDPAEEKHRSVLIGSSYDSEWFVTYDVRISGTESLKDIQEVCPELLKNHLRNSSLDADVSITSSYELCGISHKMIDCKEHCINDFKGYLKIEGNWNTLSFLPPLTTYSNNLDAEIISGSTASSLNDLWNQLSILDKFLSMVDDYHKRHLSSRYSVQPLIFPKSFVNPYIEDEDSVRKKLSRLLIGDDYVEDDESSEELDNVNSKEFKLITFVKELARRQNLDFTDKFWQIVRSADCYFLMTDCVHEIFESMREHNFKPDLNSMEDTRFARMVSAFVDEQKGSLHAGSISLELVIDMGIEKVTRDYTYLLSNMNVMDMYDLRKMIDDVTNGEFDVDKYRKRLRTLMQIHVSLEFLELIQSQLNCRYDISQTIFDTALKSFRGPKSPLDFSDLSQPQFYMLSMPAPKEFMSEVKSRAPSSWMCTLSSTKKYEKWSTIFHYSRVPIFPPNVYTPDDLERNQTINDDIYHTTVAKINYMKYN